MEQNNENGGRRSKRLILKRNNEKLQKAEHSSDHKQNDIFNRTENKASKVNRKRFKLKDSPANIKINSSVLAETANAYRATIRRGLRKRRKSVTIENHKPFANTTNDNSNDYLTIEDTRLNNNIDIKKSYSSDVKDDSIDTSLNIANVQNISSTTTNICHLDDPASISADANNDPQFTIKCEIDVEEILTEQLVDTNQGTENELNRNDINEAHPVSLNDSNSDYNIPPLNNSDLGSIIRADHDYIDLLVDAIKKEPPDDDEHRNCTANTNTVPNLSSTIKQEPDDDRDTTSHHKTTRIEKDALNIKSEPEDVEEEQIFSWEDEPCSNSYISSKSNSRHGETPPLKCAKQTDGQYEQKSNLSTLAEVSLAAAGEFYEPNLKQQIDLARANLYPSNERVKTSISSNQSECSSNGTPKISPNLMPTIDLPQSVKDAILASANISSSGSLSKNHYDSPRQENRTNQVPSMYQNHTLPTPSLPTSCNKTSIELSHTSNRRMQITLPENTTHIVICTSGRANNNEPINDNNSSTSLTLDINPSTSNTPFYQSVDRVQGNKGYGDSNAKGINDIPVGNKSQIFLSQNNVAMNHRNQVIKHMTDDRKEPNNVGSIHNQERNSSDASTNDDYMNDGGKKSNYNCSECGKSYSTSSNLARHRQTHRSLDDTKAKKCPYCSKIYVSMPAFSMHMRTHNQNCKCNFCGKTFSRPWLLQGHLRTHTGERPYSCQICSKAFADKSNLRAHVQTHSSNKPYRCKHCGKTFALKSYLYKHEEAACLKNVAESH